MTISDKIPSRLDIIPDFIFGLTEKLKSLALAEKDAFNIKLSLEEALVNAIKHGNRLNPDLCVEVMLEATDERIEITVRDQGQGFNVVSIADPTAPENLKKSSGRGVFLMKHLMDKVEYFDGGRGVKMIKFFKKEAGHEDR
jgi:serine/threonine-protein kinase RsbW